MFLTECQKKLIGTGIWVDFKKPGKSNRFTGLFTETGMTGMLEAADFDSVDMVSPFLGAIVDE